MFSSRSEKSVRFSGVSDTTIHTRSSDAIDDLDRKPLKKCKLKKDDVERMNEDELDDVDEWIPEDEMDEIDTQADISERDLREAKRERRTKRVVGALGNIDDDDGSADYSGTRIDYRTSLAAEGIQVEPFNMDQERNDGSGYFDGDTYIFRKRDIENEEVDAWVEGLDNGEIEEVDVQHKRKAMVREDHRRLEKSIAIDERMDNWTEDDLYAKLLPHLQGNETVMSALIRYGKIFEKKNLKNVVSLDANALTLAQDAFNDITEASNALLLKGKIDIYELKRTDIELLQNSLRPLVHASTSNAANKVQWEYKGNHDGQIHGPYSTEDMLGWIRLGYFVGETAVQVRTVQEVPPSLESKSLQEDLLSDLLSEDNSGAQPQNSSSILQRGEWMISDKVDFLKY